ncbi:MAG: MerR family transcriptional regulator [Mycobacteriaceae bacterium]
MMEYRIDDLAREAGVSVRNVRVYQDRGLLPPPRRQGRTGWYSESHLVRLNLISSMLDRGYTFATISELLIAAQYGLRVEDVLASGAKSGKWGQIRRVARITIGELRRRFGEDQTTKENIERGTALGVLTKAGKEFTVTSPALIEAAEELVRVGIPLEEILLQSEKVRGDLEDVAERFVGLITSRYLVAEGETLELAESEVSQIASLINKLRPLASETVHALFADAMERALSRGLEKTAQQLKIEIPKP